MKFERKYEFETDDFFNHICRNLNYYDFICGAYEDLFDMSIHITPHYPQMIKPFKPQCKATNGFQMRNNFKNKNSKYGFKGVDNL